jgi:hypothetical protein
VIGALTEGKVAKGFLLMHAPQRLHVERVHPRLEIDQEAAFLLPGGLAAVLNAQAPRDVDRNGLGEIDVLAGVDAGGRLLGVEVGRGNDRHGIHLVQKLQIAFEPGVAIGRGHTDFVAKTIRAILEVVRCRDDVVSAMGLEELGDPGAASAAADDAQIDLGVGRKGADGARGHHGQGRRGRAGHESAPTDLLGNGLQWGGILRLWHCVVLLSIHLDDTTLLDGPGPTSWWRTHRRTLWT